MIQENINGYVSVADSINVLQVLQFT